MSDTNKRSVTMEVIKREDVPAAEKAQCLQTAIFDVTKAQVFVGSVLQCMNIAYTHAIPTAGVAFNNDNKRWDLWINPHFFCRKLNQVQRAAVMQHEMYHILNKHPFRVPFMKLAPQKRMLMNIAADMAINQFIQGLPSGCSQCPPIEAKQQCPNQMCPGRCIDVKDFHDEDESTKKKTQWSTGQTMEYYYEKLLTKFEDPEEGEGDGEGNAGGGASSGDLPKTLDEHQWDASADEKDMLEATEDLVKRAMVKQRMSYDQLPGSIKELLEEIQSRKSELNYKSIIHSALKKSLSGNSRKHTWSRKSRRFGSKAPGTTQDDLPKLDIYLDSSGSISIEELNEFLDIVDDFLKVGARECTINLFHTENYYTEKYRLGNRIDRDMVESGGTDLTESLKRIADKKPDLAVFVTDGVYGDVNVEEWMGSGQKFPQCVFIISRQGQEKHPLERLGQTVKIPETSGK